MAKMIIQAPFSNYIAPSGTNAPGSWGDVPEVEIQAISANGLRLGASSVTIKVTGAMNGTAFRVTANGSQLGGVQIATSGTVTSTVAYSGPSDNVSFKVQFEKGGLNNGGQVILTVVNDDWVPT